VIETPLLLVRKFALEFPCELTGVREACQRSRAELAGAGLSEDELGHWELVLAEAGNNAVYYALGWEKHRPVRFEFYVDAQWVEARVQDHGPGFDLPDEVELPPPDSEDGRGLFLIKTLTDEAAYYRGRGGNWLVLRKKRQTPGAPSAPPSDVATVVAPAVVTVPIADNGWTEKLAASESTLELMTEELASAYESLATIFRFSAELADQPKPEEFARKWLGEVSKIVAADWFILRLFEEGEGLKLVASSMDMAGLEALSLENAGEADVSLEMRAASFRMDVWFDSAHPVAAVDPLAKLARQGSGFSHPMVINDRLVGVLSVGRHLSDTGFQAGQVSLIQTFADFLGIQIRNTQFQQQQLQSKLTARELQIAADIQRSLLPKQLPLVPGFQLVGHYQSARQVGGDFYDAFEMKNGGLLLAIADVMGKGVPAAMFAAIFRSQLRAAAERSTSPATMLTWLNRSLFADLDQVEMFITAELVCFHPRDRTFLLSAAGHPPLILAGRDGRLQAVENSGLPLGVLADTEYTERTVTLPAGANLLLFTDGLTEARDPEGKLLWLGPLEKCLAQGAKTGQGAEATKAALIALVEGHQQGVPPGDDQTFLLLAELRPDARPAILTP
jgi:serine phosphatase RsbU (regulator of sigma subunit)/anti-sigma regulatory factor (Ser/Thr protein kinase)